MTDAVKMTLGLMRGYDYQRTWSLIDEASGASLVAVDDTLSLVIKTSAGASPALITLEHEVTNTVTGISDIDVGAGTFSVTIRAASLDAVPGGDLEQAKVAFVLTKETADGLVEAFAYGPCVVEPEA